MGSLIDVADRENPIKLNKTLSKQEECYDPSNQKTPRGRGFEIWEI